MSKIYDNPRFEEEPKLSKDFNPSFKFGFIKDYFRVQDPAQEF